MKKEDRIKMYLEIGFTEEDAIKSAEIDEKLEKWQAQRKAMKELYKIKTGKRRR